MADQALRELSPAEGYRFDFPETGGMTARPVERLLIVPSLEQHCAVLAANLRPADRAEVQAAGLSSIRAVKRAFRGSIMCRTAFVDGEIAAMWGLGGTLLSDVGHPWLLTTAASERLPVTYVKTAKRELAAMLDLRPHLYDYVAADYGKAVALLKLLGFALGDPVPLGRRQGLFRKFEMRR